MGKTEKSARSEALKSKSDKAKDKKDKKDKKDRSKIDKVKKTTKLKTKKDKKSKDKKDKSKDKKDKGKDKKTDPPVDDKASVQTSGSRWNNWEDAEFESDARKAKFLRLMGIKKDGNDSGSSGGGGPKKGPSPFASAITKEGASRIHSDLEKQFGAGIEKRRQGGRGGLGF
ncbi:hypothetical protein GGF46_002287 [Coemansia sp. RSA 552]|nr:hypothetical protein GGF46_002287 [Coemansia sp. RSA 552]